jgi:hypothetical protein
MKKVEYKEEGQCLREEFGYVVSYNEDYCKRMEQQRR